MKKVSSRKPNSSPSFRDNKIKEIFNVIFRFGLRGFFVKGFESSHGRLCFTSLL